MENSEKRNFDTKFSKKQALITMSMILLLTLSALVAGIQFLTVQAAKDADIQSYSFIVCAPNPVGVNQPVLVNLWVADPLPSAASGIGQFRTGFKVTISDPSGHNTTKTDLKPDYLGGAHFTYTPTAVGSYTFFFEYPSETIYYEWDSVNNKPLNPQNNFTQLGSNATDVLVVQSEPVQSVFQVPYPTQFWTRPIYGQNYFWAQISSNWLMARWNSTSALFDNNEAFVPEGKAPNSAHILWTKPMSFGGLAGGIYGNVPYYSGMSYEEYFASSLLAGSGPAIVISGRLYYTTIAGGEPIWYGELGNLGTTCVDLYTGQTLFTIPNATMSFGQIFSFPGINQAGTHAYLWSTSGPIWKMYDAWSGNLIASIANITGGGFAGPTTFGPHGEIINYALVPGAGGVQLVKWNSTKVFNAYQPTGTGTLSADYSWRPYTMYGAVLDGNKGIEWQVPAVNDPAYTLLPMLIQDGYYDGNDILAAKFGGTSGATNVSSTVGWDIAAYDMTTGKQDYTSHIAPAPGMPNCLDGIAAFNTVWEYNGHLYSFNHYTLQWVQYDIRTGDVMWVSHPMKNAYGYFGQAASLIEAYGLTIVAGFDGWAYGYDTTTGATVWEYYAGNSGLLNPYGHFTFYNGITVVDGKVILLPNEHGSGVEPLYQNLTITVLDAKTGKVAWNVLGYFEQPIVADAIVLSHNNYDNQIYAFGKGPSATNVTASPKTVNSGSTVLIEGSVTDQSPGAKDSPAIADRFMSTWMEYVYMQQGNPSMNLPGEAGVPVLLTATALDGTVTTIGTVTSDCTGNFVKAWTAPGNGVYTISANFLGTDSYWPSFAVTHISVGPAPSPSQGSPSPSFPTGSGSPSTSTSATPPGVVNPTELYLVAVAIIVIVIIIAAAVALRRRK